MMRRVCSAILLALMVLAAVVILSGAAGAGVAEGLEYLKARQNQDGGFCEPGEESGLSLTCWVMIAASSTGEDPLSWSNAGAGPLQYLSQEADRLIELEDIELCALALAEVGADPRDLSGRDLVSLVAAHIQQDGRIGEDLQEHCLGVISLAAAGEGIDSKVAGWLISQQREDGGWGESEEDAVLETSLAIQALVAVGETNVDTFTGGLRFLRERMNTDGGFAGERGTSISPLTSMVIMAIHAAGDDPASPPWDFHGFNPAAYLVALQASDGHFQYSEGVESQPSLTTAMAMTAVTGRHLPLNAGAAGVTLQGESGTGDSIQDIARAGASISEGSATPGKGDETDGSRRGSSGGQIILAGKGISGGASAKSTSWVSGFWLFMMVCGIYLLLLCLVGVLVGILVSGGTRSRYS